MENFLGAMPPPPHSRQPLPVIAEPSYADVARYADGATHQGHRADGSSLPRPLPSQPPHSQLHRPQPRPSVPQQHAEPPAPPEGREGREGSDSTERLLLSSSPPSESLFPFAPTPNT